VSTAGAEAGKKPGRGRRVILWRHGQTSWNVERRFQGSTDVELTETGSSIRANNLRVLDTLLQSTIRFVANKSAWAAPWKREKMENIAMLLKGAIDARAKVGLKLNAPESKLADIIMLDNMTPAQIREAIALRKDNIEFEASGGITLKNVNRIAATGVDYISVGSLTHGARAIDICLEMTHVPG